MALSWISPGSATRSSSSRLQAVLHCPASVDVIDVAEALADEHSLRVSARGLSSLTLAAPRPWDNLVGGSFLGGAPRGGGSFLGGGSGLLGGGSFLGGVASRLAGVGDPTSQTSDVCVQVEPGEAEFGGRVKVSVTASPSMDTFFNAFLDSMGEAVNRAEDLQQLDDFLAASPLAEAPSGTEERARRKSLEDWYGGDRKSTEDLCGDGPAAGDEDHSAAGKRSSCARASASGPSQAAVFAIMSRGVSRGTSICTEAVVCPELKEEDEPEAAVCPELKKEEDEPEAPSGEGDETEAAVCPELKTEEGEPEANLTPSTITCVSPA